MQANEASIDRLISQLQNAGRGALPPRPPLKGGGEGGTFDPMEARVAVLEAHVEHIRSDLGKLSSVPETLARLDERVSNLGEKVAHLPTKVDLTAMGDSLSKKLQIYLAIAVAITVIVTFIAKLV